MFLAIRLIKYPAKQFAVKILFDYIFLSLNTWSEAGVVKLLHAASEGILCCPQGSHTHIDIAYFESMLK